MKEPKYKIGDTVWTMRANRPEPFNITRINITITTYDEEIEYVLNSSGDKFLEENEAWFPTKQDLINSL